MNYKNIDLYKLDSLFEYCTKYIYNDNDFKLEDYYIYYNIIKTFIGKIKKNNSIIKLDNYVYTNYEKDIIIYITNYCNDNNEQSIFIENIYYILFNIKENIYYKKIIKNNITVNFINLILHNKIKTLNENKKIIFNYYNNMDLDPYYNKIITNYNYNYNYNYNLEIILNKDNKKICVLNTLTYRHYYECFIEFKKIKLNIINKYYYKIIYFRKIGNKFLFNNKLYYLI